MVLGRGLCIEGGGFMLSKTIGFFDPKSSVQKNLALPAAYNYGFECIFPLKSQECNVSAEFAGVQHFPPFQKISKISAIRSSLKFLQARISPFTWPSKGEEFTLGRNFKYPRGGLYI